MEVEIKRWDASSSFLLVFLLIFVGCSQRGFDPAAEQAKLLRRDAEWARHGRIDRAWTKRSASDASS
jgi:hypothetical protein